MTTNQELRLPSQRIARRTMFIWAGQAAIWMVVRCLIVVAVVFALPQNDAPAVLQRPNAFMWVAVPFIWGLLEVFVWPLIKYNVHRWEVTETALYTRVGLFSTHSTIVPINRLQNVEVSQSAMERLAGLAHIVATTAGDSVTIGTIYRADADALTQRLIAAISADDGDAT